MSIEFKPVQVLTGSPDREGRLVLIGGQLVAVLVRLDAAAHGTVRGAWFLEAGFGRLREVRAPFFAGLDGARDWIQERLRASGPRP